MHTEDEAKKLWCPEHRGIIGSESANNNFHSDTCCIASQCMHWRWDMKWVSSSTDGTANGNVVVVLERLKGEPKRGYCGLSGRPEQ